MFDDIHFYIGCNRHGDDFLKTEKSVLHKSLTLYILRLHMKFCIIFYKTNGEVIDRNKVDTQIALKKF